MEDDPKLVCVYQTFNTSFGLIAVLDFTKGVILRPGVILENESGNKWKIVGMMLPKSIEMTNFTFTPKFSEFIYSCRLESLDHSELIKDGELLRVKE